VLNAIGQGWSMLIAQRKAWLMIYGCNLLFTLVVVVPMHSWLKSAGGHSLALTRSIGDFDFTVIGDLLRNYGTGMFSLVAIALVVAVLYLVLTAFLNGGILHLFVHSENKYSGVGFVTGGMRYFWRLLGMATLFLVIHVIVLGILCGVFLTIGINPFQMENDVQFLKMTGFILTIYAFIFFLVLLMHTYAKVRLVESENGRTLKAIKNGTRFVVRHVIPVFCIYLINGLFLVAVFLIVRALKGVIPDETIMGLILLLLIGQFAIIARIGIRLLVMSSAVAYRKLTPRPPLS
jgi:hypothetical protein